jgi:hypothetical protein
VYIDPPANSTGPYSDWDGRTVFIKFNKAMVPSSVREAARITSSLGRPGSDEFSIRSSAGDGIFLTPFLGSDVKGWSVRETLTVTVSRAARDVNDNWLEHEYSGSFVPKPFFRVIPPYHYWDADVYNAPVDIGIMFNSLLDSTIFEHVHLSPAVEGQWQFGIYASTDSSSIWYAPSIGYPAGVVFTLTVDGDAKDRYGNVVEAPFSDTVHPYISEFRLTSTYPSGGTENVDPANPYKEIRLSFNRGLDTSTIRQSFRIDPAVTGDFRWPNRFPNAFSFLPFGEYPLATRITVTMDTTLHSILGEKMRSAYAFSFTTDSFRVIAMWPSNGSEYVDRLVLVGAYVNAVVDTSTVRGAFVIAPAVAGYFTFGESANEVSGRWVIFHPTDSLAPHTLYSAIISTDLQARSGPHLARDHQVSFVTRY